MKKVAIFLAAIALTTGVFAQTFNPPTKDINWFGSSDKDYADAEDAEERTGIRRTKNTTPIAPATLLLLGLGGAVVGTRVVRNTKK